MATLTATESVGHGSMVPVPFRVVDTRQETADTHTLDLEPVEGPGIEMAPGQFVMVYVFGVGEVPISVSGIPGDGGMTLTVRNVGAVSGAICAAEAGTVLGLRGPCGPRAWPVAGAVASDVVIVAGGIGLAPLRPVVRHVLTHHRDYGHISVLYGARTPGELLYLDEIETWREQADVGITVDRGDEGWTGQVGVVPKLISSARFDTEAHAFVCGPEVMMHFTADALLDRGLDPDRIHLSMERHMDCGIGLCGHCQLGPTLICRDGPVYTQTEIARWMEVREL